MPLSPTSRMAIARESSRALEKEFDTVLCLMIQRNRGIETRCGNAAAVDWSAVADAFQRYLRSMPRLSTGNVVDMVEHFTPGVCRQRARYLVWSYMEKRKATVGFHATQCHANGGNVPAAAAGGQGIPPPGPCRTKSIYDVFDEIAARLPSIADDDDDDDDDDDASNHTNTIVNPMLCPMEESGSKPVFFSFGEEERRLHALQQEELAHYRTTGTWLTQPLNLMSKSDVARLLKELELTEHTEAFRRTDGALLLTLQKQDIERRFGSDMEAADIFWARLDKIKMLHHPDVLVQQQPQRVPVEKGRNVSGSPTRISDLIPREQITKQKALDVAVVSSGVPPPQQQHVRSSRNENGPFAPVQRDGDRVLPEKLAALEAYEREHRDILQGRIVVKSEPAASSSSTTEGKGGDNISLGVHYLNEMKRSMFPLRPLRPHQQNHVDPNQSEEYDNLYSDPITSEPQPSVPRSASKPESSKLPLRPGRWSVIEYSDEDDEDEDEDEKKE